jgi:CDP-glucose 4,6-dehydratase
VENLVDQKLFSGIYNGKRVLVTGHTGFKGSWLSYWLEQMGATVCGYSTKAPSKPAHIDHLSLNIESIIGDIRNQELLEETINNFKPEIVFHLAAQPLVRLSYKDPIETYETNVMGSLKVYEACRKCDSITSIVTITTDKVYENNEWLWGYRENDRLGGKDPYSSSKAAMEILTSSYIHSYFNEKDFETHNKLVATVRAGNVIGGGDWAQDRLIPDIIKASLKKEPVEIRSPHSTRPWQHVLEPLSGYLMVGQKLLERDITFASPFNFGPPVSEDLSVQGVVENLKKHWDVIDYIIKAPKEKMHEATLLKLDCTKANNLLNWRPSLEVEESLEMTIKWYKEFYENNSTITKQDLDLYIKKARNKNAAWC